MKYVIQGIKVLLFADDYKGPIRHIECLFLKIRNTSFKYLEERPELKTRNTHTIVSQILIIVQKK